MSEPAGSTIWTKWLLLGSQGLCVAIAISYFLQPDWLAAVVLVPPWFWLLPAGLSLLVSFRHRQSVLFRLTVVVWIVFLLVFVEQSRTMLRVQSWPTSQWLAACREGQCLRVITLNCGDGGERSLREVAEWNPDLVLLQESPGEDAVRQTARDLFGEDAFLVYESDTTIVGRGELKTQLPEDADHFVHARIEFFQGQNIEVISLHLSPPVFRVDCWTPGFWRDHRDRRRQHRHEIEALKSHLEEHTVASPVLLGGDFNAPPYDAALWVLDDEFRDTFAQAGRGWGATGPNEYPLFRIDQIWVNEAFRIGAAVSHKTVHSDHRMVVCDLRLKPD